VTEVCDTPIGTATCPMENLRRKHRGFPDDNYAPTTVFQSHALRSACNRASAGIAVGRILARNGRAR